ncbi:MAG: hypothetical protein JJ969_07415 [Rhizobiaceae bacterium]|nr:hypothetical protein [Rhizobiaceae bacterium]
MDGDLSTRAKWSVEKYFEEKRRPIEAAFSTWLYFSRLTPLNGVPSFFPSIKRPVSVSRFVHVSVFGL